MKLAIIGAGKAGGALGKGWARAGHEIAFGVSTPNDPKHDAAAKAAGNAPVTDVATAVEGADAIVLCVPWASIESAVAACGDLTGRLVIDGTNPLSFGPNGLGLAVGFSTSGGEEVARLARGASVFKTLQQVGSEVMGDASGYVQRPVMFVAGDDAVLKPTVLALVGDLGFEARDAGKLERARLLEPYAMLWIDQVVSHGMAGHNAFGLMVKDLS